MYLESGKQIDQLCEIYGVGGVVVVKRLCTPVILRDTVEYHLSTGRGNR
jgi:hypothetical protein